VGFSLLSLTLHGLIRFSLNHYAKTLAVVSALVLLAACGQRNTDYLYDKKTDNTEKLIRVNKYMVTSDSLAIVAYAKRHNWNLSVTPSGLWYEIVKKGNGKQAQKEMKVKMAYLTELLDGTRCYSSDSLGLKEFRIGHGGVEAGLEQAALLLTEGDSARFILPPYLAYGLAGDGNKIGKRECLVYIVSVQQLIQK